MSESELEDQATAGRESKNRSGATSTVPGVRAPSPSSRSVLWTFGALMAFLGAGYGVLFTMLDDYRDEYGISESALGGSSASGSSPGSSRS